MIIAELKVIPLKTSGSGLSEYVSRAVEEIHKSGLNYQVNPTGTSIEASDIDELLEVTKKAHKAVLDAGASRVLTMLNLDERTDKEEGINDRIEKVLPKESI